MTLPPFERLLDDHGAVVLRVCRTLLPVNDADDAWSETFLSALEAYPGLKDASNLRGWLVTIAHRKAMDHYRRASRSNSTARPEGASVDRYPSDGDGGLWQALSDLPERQKEAVALHHVAGLPYKDVASLTGSTAEAARRAAADGIAALRRKLAEENNR